MSSTRIFARATERSTQFLAYQMKYGSKGENAMILPVPVRQPVRDDSLRFIDLQGYPQLFEDLEDGFPYEHSGGFGCSEPVKSPTGGTKLEVFKVGNYVASFVPNLASFLRLDPRFRLPESTWAMLPQYRDFGFAVFQLAAGSLEPHPMAFEFETSGTSIFFPTLHIHDGAIHPSEEFDHALYLQHAGYDSRVDAYRNSDVRDPTTGLVRSKFAAAGFCDAAKSQGLIDANLLVHKSVIRGLHLNQDTIFAVSGHPTRRSLNLRRLVRMNWPWLLFVAAAAWFFARRRRIKNQSTGSLPNEA